MSTDRAEIVVRWNSVEVLHAPEHSYITLELIAAADPRILAVHGNVIHLAEARYRVTGWNDQHMALEVSREH